MQLQLRLMFMHLPSRHKMYDAYKAGRHGMPDELRQQMPVLKICFIISDIKRLSVRDGRLMIFFGTLAEGRRSNGDECFIATGDRDSLQLPTAVFRFCFARTKMWGRRLRIFMMKTQFWRNTVLFLPGLFRLRLYKVTPSDNIPGVAGVGAKRRLI